MNTKTIKILTGVLSVFCLTSCTNYSKTDIKNLPGTGYIGGDYVAIKQLNHHIKVGEKSQIIFESMPNNYASTLNYSSFNEQVATVNQAGEISAVSKGMTKIAVKRNDGSLLTYANVLVTNKDGSDVETSIQNIKNGYGPTYVTPTKVHQVEYSYETYYKEGVSDHGYYSFQEMYFDKDEGYFMMSGDDLSSYTLNGNKELDSGIWIFEVLSLFKTRMIHITDTVRNFYDFNSSAYGLAKYQVIYDILDLYFVSGRKIAVDLMDDYGGKKTFVGATKSSSSEYVFAADGKNDMSISYTQGAYESTISTKDELETFDIPEGTKYIQDYDSEYLYQSNKCLGFNASSNFSYQIGSDNWNRVFYRSQVCDEEYKPVLYEDDEDDMKKAGWNKVDYYYEL